jgi:hypothetical protein
LNGAISAPLASSRPASAALPVWRRAVAVAAGHEPPVAAVAQVAEPRVVAAAVVRGQPAAEVAAALVDSALGVAVAASAA